MRHSELKDNIGKRVKLNGEGDLAMIRERRKYIFDDVNEYELFLDGVTKGGLAILRCGKEVFTVGCKNVDLYAA